MRHILALLLLTTAAQAAGELHIYNWADYTNPDLIAKFEKVYDVKVTMDSYDSNETMISKVRAGNSGFDIVVPGDYAVQIMIQDGLLEKTQPSAFPNFKNIKPAYRDFYFDMGRHYTVPWQSGLTSFAVDSAVYSGDINTYAILFDPPDELKGKINILDDITSTMHAAERFLSIPRCATSKADLKKLQDLLLTAKDNWKTFSFDAFGLIASGDVAASMVWNGDAYRARAKRGTVRFAHPKEGIERFVDNVAVLKDAPNKENAKLFQNFVMDPENAGLISTYSGYDNGIVGSNKYMPPELAASPEINYPTKAPQPELVPPCSPETVEIYNQIWTEVRK